MSTILRALEKARRERLQEGREETPILDVPGPPPSVAPKVIVRHSRRWMLVAVAVAFSTLLSVALVVGVFVYLEQRLEGWLGRAGVRAEATSVAAPSAASVAEQPGGRGEQSVVARMRAGGGTAAMPTRLAAGGPRAEVPGALDLPTPVPMSELLREAETAASPSPSPNAARVAATQVGERPAVSAGEGEQGFVLGPILYDPRSPMAIVNGQSVREGGVYENFRVLRITPDSVTVQRAGHEPVVLRKRR